MKMDYNDYILVIHLLCWSQCSTALQLRPHLDPISGEGRSMSGQRAGSESVRGSCLESCSWAITIQEWPRRPPGGPVQVQGRSLPPANTVNSYRMPGMAPGPGVDRGAGQWFLLFWSCTGPQLRLGWDRGRQPSSNWYDSQIIEQVWKWYKLWQRNHRADEDRSRILVQNVAAMVDGI